MYDVAIVGGGIVGLATAYRLLERKPGLSVLVLEKEDVVAFHQSGRNSGVLHAGIYYQPGSLKARLCRRGRAEMVRFCEIHEIRFELCGKVIVAASESERDRLEALLERGRANGVSGLRAISRDELREIEPHADGVAALHSPETGIVSFRQVAEALANEVEHRGGVVETGVELVGLRRNETRAVVALTTSGEREARLVVAAAGLHADRVAALGGEDPSIRVVPFRGEYYRLKPGGRHLVQHLIYPVPDPQFPFLGVHFTRRIDGSVEAGPNAVLALAREGYRKSDVDWGHLWELARFSGFWRMGRRYWRTGIGEYHRSLSKRAFVRGLRRLVPDISEDDLEQGGTGVRAQALAENGLLVDDFRVARSGNVIHVLNAPSPAATSSLAIGDHVVNYVLGQAIMR